MLLKTRWLTSTTFRTSFTTHYIYKFYIFTAVRCFLFLIINRTNFQQTLFLSPDPFDRPLPLCSHRSMIPGFSYLEPLIIISTFPWVGLFNVSPSQNIRRSIQPQPLSSQNVVPNPNSNSKQFEPTLADSVYQERVTPTVTMYNLSIQLSRY